MQLAHNQTNGGSIPSVPTRCSGWSVLSSSLHVQGYKPNRGMMLRWGPAEMMPFKAPCIDGWLCNGSTARKREKPRNGKTYPRPSEKTQSRFDSCPSDQRPDGCMRYLQGYKPDRTAAMGLRRGAVKTFHLSAPIHHHFGARSPAHSFSFREGRLSVVRAG